MAQEIYVVIEFDRETHEFSKIEAICQSKEEAENLVKTYNAKFLRYSYEWFEETYHVEEVDAVLAEKDAEIRRLKRALWNARVLALRRFSVLSYFQKLGMKGKKSKMDFNEIADRIDLARLKCRAKAEEYK